MYPGIMGLGFPYSDKGHPRDRACAFALTFATVLSVVIASDDLALQTNQVEFKTQAPPDPFPQAPKDCYEYLFGKLSAIRTHGSTWQNGVADCSNCTCDNGDIRCFFHFCNEPSTGYMTPPTVGGDMSLPPPSTETNSPEGEEREEEEEESSGYPPAEGEIRPQDSETEVEVSMVEWPAKVLPEKWHKELSAFETSSAPSDASGSHADGGFSLLEEGEQRHQDRTENETHDVRLKNFFCGKTCKKICPKGFKVDVVTGCWKCKCDVCPKTPKCVAKCPLGYAIDAAGCKTCDCVATGATASTDADIVFTDGEGDLGQERLLPFDAEEGEKEGEEDDDEEGEEVEEEEDREDSLQEDSLRESSQSSSSSSSEEGLEEEGVLGGPLSETQTEEPSGKSKEAGVTSFPGIREGKGKGTLGDDEPCDTATSQLRGCLDGTQKFHVGKTWSRGPCVACKCVAPGYSECHITQCHTLPHCPMARRFTPLGACCALCKDPPRPGFLEIGPSGEDKSKASSSVSSNLGEESLLQKEDFKELEDEATIRSIPQGGNSHLLLILIPMGVLFSVGVLLFAHLWRRYHRDKYDINAYRPEEKQKLRPVKTLNEDTSSLAHVC